MLHGRLLRWNGQHLGLSRRLLSNDLLRDSSRSRDRDASVTSTGTRGLDLVSYTSPDISPEAMLLAPKLKSTRLFI